VEERHLDLAIDYLQRLLHLLPVESGAQDLVAGDEVPPGTDERGDVERAGQPHALPHDVDPGGGGIQAVEEHRLLQRRKLREKLDVIRVQPGLPPSFFQLRLPIRAISLSRSFWLTRAVGKSAGVKTAFVDERQCSISERSAATKRSANA
jgi:hypothetical protein